MKPTLLKTSRDEKHYHIAYIKESETTDPMSGAPTTVLTGMTTQAKGHAHNIIDGLIQAAPDYADLHIHTLEAYPVKEKNEDQKDSEIVEDVLRLYKEAKEQESASVKKAKESEEFVSGVGQWDKAEVDKLKSQSRAALTINELEPKIDLLSGYQRQNRTDWKFLPVEDGDSTVSDVLNVVVKNISEQCNYDHEETKAFEDQAIVGRGLFNLYVDYDKDIRGCIIVEKFPWGDVYFGTHEKLDLSDCEYIIKHKWYSKALINQMWPTKSGELTKEIDLYLDAPATSHQIRGGDQYADTSNAVNVTLAPDMEFIDLARKEYRVLECWRKVYERNRIIVNVEDDFYFNAKGWKDADIEAIKTLGDFSVIDRVAMKMRISKVASKVLLDDDMPELAYNNFHIFPVYAKKRGKEWWGKVEAVKDMQREINKRHSQSVDILNKVAAYGWFYDDSTFSTPQDAEKFRTTSSSPGFTTKVADLNHKPERVEGVRFPAEIVQMETIASQKLREVMGINLEMEGMGGQRASGTAILERKKQGLVGNEFLFDNLAMTKRNLGRAIVAHVGKLYNAERLLRIVKNQDKRQPVSVNGQPVADMDETQLEAIKKILETADLTEYDVIVSDSPFSASMRQANFVVWLELAKTRPEVPLDFLIDLSDLPDKEKFKEMLAEQAQAQQAQEDKKYQTEIQKTAMAKGLPMPQDMPPQGGGMMG